MGHHGLRLARRAAPGCPAARGRRLAAQAPGRASGPPHHRHRQPRDFPVSGGTGERYADEPPITIANEFAEVRIRKVLTRNGERLELEAHRRGYRILLDAVELESLTWQTHETFAKFLRASTGRDEED